MPGPVRTPAAALVFAARALDRANELDSARAQYEAAAALLPTIADWLRLRAAGVTADPAVRARAYAGLRTAVARARIRWTEAIARERTADLEGAARAYDSLGAHVDALRARAAMTDTAQRVALCADIEQFIGAHTGGPDARAAIDIADRVCAPLPHEAEESATMAAAASGAVSRAIAGFARLESTGTLDPGERFAFGLALSRARRDADAAKQFTRVTGPLAHAATYQRARVLVASGDKMGARSLLRGLLRAAPRDTSAANALMLLADLAADERNDAQARDAYLTVAVRFPASAHASRARYRAAMIAYVAGRYRIAAREWDALAHGEDAVAAKYWSARASAALGDTTAARTRWRGIVAGEPLSYYAGLSGRRLDARAAVPPVGDDTTPPPLDAAVDSAVGRAVLLDDLGMDTEARFETDYVSRASTGTAADLMGLGAALTRAGEPSRGIAFGWRLLARGDSLRRDARVYRLVFPLLFGDRLAAEARAASLDPALVAAVIRQESNFNPKAVSSAGARGLMQIMPGIGHDIARARKVGPWDPALLDQPDMNLAFGVSHLATFLTQEHGSIVRGLAAYNAGPSRVTLWSARRGTDDPEVFVERIPFAETRDYVRAIVRGRDLYAALYHL